MSRPRKRKLSHSLDSPKTPERLETTRINAVDETAASAPGYLKLAKLRGFFNLRRQSNKLGNDECSAAVMRSIFEAGGDDVNYRIPSDAPLKLHSPELLGCTALHLAAGQRDESVCKALLDLGADVAIKNRREATALRSLLETARDENRDKSKKGVAKSLANMILNFQENTKNGQNPGCKDGVTHLHVACAYGNVAAVELLLDAGHASVNERVSLDSKFAAGYTPLHFAVKHCDEQIVELLLERGADRLAEDARALTPLHRAILRKIELVEKYGSSKVGFHGSATGIDAILELLTPEKAEFCQALDRTGLTPLHLACVMGRLNESEESVRSAENLNLALSLDSPIFPGYTAAHFAAYLDDSFELLVACGADIFAKDAEGETPFDIWMKYARTTDVIRVVETSPQLNAITFTDGITSLTQVLRAMSDSFREFVTSKLAKSPNIRVSLNSPLWPGCTILHLIALFSHDIEDERLKNMIQRVMECPGQDCRMKDAIGRTALELAANLGNRSDTEKVVSTIVECFCEQVFRQPTSRADVNYTFMAVCSNRVDVLERCLKNGGDANEALAAPIKWHSDATDKVFARGSTPLHAAVSVDTTKLLLEHGADPTVQDDDGMTALHLAFLHGSADLVRLLLSQPSLQRNIIASKGGLSNLHVACCAGHIDAIETLSSSVENLNDHAIHPVSFECSATSSFFRQYEADTPLHFAVQTGSIEAVDCLIAAGGSVFAKNAKGLSPLHLATRSAIDPFNTPSSDRTGNILNYFLRIFRRRAIRFREDCGWTMLHLACAALNQKFIRAALKTNDVNDRIHEDSPISPGCTALHVLASVKAYVGEKSAKRIVRLLYASGADPGIKNVDGETPIHVAHANGRGKILDILLRYQPDFSMNPTNNEGLSHFHIACTRKNVKLVESYLENGANVHSRTDCFISGDTAGYTPLHFSARWGSFEIFEALLAHGADPNRVDTVDRTPLHVAALYSPEKDTDCYVRAAKRIGKLDVNATDLLGESLLEMILRKKCKSTNRTVELLLSSGARLNYGNSVTGGENLLLRLIDFHWSPPAFADDEAIGQSTLLRLLDLATDLDRLEEVSGRSAIHLVMSEDLVSVNTNGVSLILKLASKGCDIDHRDREGKTALHLAIESDCLDSPLVLLALGSDVNVVDNAGETALQRLNRHHPSGMLMSCFMHHLYKLTSRGFRLNDANQRVYNGEDRSIDEWYSIVCNAELERMKQREVVVNSLSLYNLLSAIFVYNYPTMSSFHREQIDRLFLSSDVYRKFPHLCGVLYTGYWMARKRLKLIEPAREALSILAVSVLVDRSLPEPCAEKIIWYLEYDDLRCLKVFGSEVKQVERGAE